MDDDADRDLSRRFSTAVFEATFSTIFFLVMALFPFVWGEQHWNCIDFKAFSTDNRLALAAYELLIPPGGYAVCFLLLGGHGAFLFYHALYYSEHRSPKIKEAYCLYLRWLTRWFLFLTLFFWLLCLTCTVLPSPFSFDVRLFLMRVIPAMLVFTIGVTDTSMKLATYGLLEKYPRLDLKTWWENDMTAAIKTARFSTICLIFSAIRLILLRNTQNGAIRKTLFAYLLFHFFLLSLPEYVGDRWISLTLKHPIPYWWKVSYQLGAITLMFFDLYYFARFDELPQEEFELAMIVLNRLVCIFSLVHLLKIHALEKAHIQ